MRKFSIFTCLVMLSLLSCRKEKFDMDLLYDSWIEETDAGHPRQTIDFNTGGDYCMIDYLNILPGSITVFRCTITGDFEVDGHYVTQVTAEVQNMEEAHAPGDFPYEGINIYDGVPLGSFYGGQGGVSLWSDGYDVTAADSEYTPVTWEILDLTESFLEVKIALDTVRYVRQ